MLQRQDVGSFCRGLSSCVFSVGCCSVPTICVVVVGVAGAVVAVFARILVMMGLVGLFSAIIFKIVEHFLKFAVCVPLQFMYSGASSGFLDHSFAL